VNLAFFRRAATRAGLGKALFFDINRFNYRASGFLHKTDALFYLGRDESERIQERWKEKNHKSPRL
jgi:hypothetical protein